MTKTKRCPKCQTWKLLTDFHKNKGKPDGLNSYCKPCALEIGKEWRSSWPLDNKKKAKKRAEIWRRDNADRVVEGRLKRKYGLTLKQYHDLSEAQDNKCAICQLPCPVKGKLSVDHCHDTGKVRGFLCDMCNKGVGNFKNSIGNLFGAIIYLREFNAHTSDK